jgi:regulatory protein
LLKLGYPEPLVDEVLVRLIEMSYLDDEAFARAWVESRDRSRPRGSAGLKRELMLKGVSRDTIDTVLAERERAAPDDDPDMAAARALLARRAAALEREPDERRRRQKAYALLARNGFGADICREAVNAEFPPS